MVFESIVNRGEFFSNHYLDAVIGGDLGDLRARWDDRERHDVPTARVRLRQLPRAYFPARGAAAEAPRARRAETARALDEIVLDALGYAPGECELELVRTGVDVVRVPAAHVTETGTGLWLVALYAGFATDVDQLFAADGAGGGEGAGVALLDRVWCEGDKRAVWSVPDAIGEIFATDEPPRYVLVVAGTVVLLADRSKWAEGRFLAVDLDAALERRDTSARGELETIAALFSADAVVPDEGQSVLDDLVERSHRHAVGVSKELRTGIRESIEILANEVIRQRLARGLAVYEGPNAIDPRELTRQCLRWLFRLVVLLYAESRPELGVLPVDDEAYLEGYSLDRLRELVLVDLDTDRARDGRHLHDSLDTLFELVNDGYHAEAAQQALLSEHAPDAGDGAGASREDYLQFPGLDAALFSPDATRLLDSVVLRNEALQQVLRKLMVAEGRTARDQAGFVSYAQLGINQLGAVYEGLMAYSGFFAREDLYEVAKGGDPADGTWMVPVDRADEYPDEVFVTRTDPVTGRAERVLHPRGSFVFRLSGRDRQRSASYYTPEVLTRCVVRHALAELLGLDDHAPEHGSSGITEARQILDLTICEPALGSGAFANEAIDQLAEEYLRRRQAELGEHLDPERHRHELQKVKAHFALHQTYGVDLNATAVELAEVSLWLNCMYPGLKAPWFGLQLRAGNSLIGCRRATWRVGQLGDRPWAATKKGTVTPPVDRSLADGPLTFDGEGAEIHHFLLPGHGWAAVAGRREARELRPDETAVLRKWRAAILKAPKKTDAARLVALARRVEELWRLAAERIRLTQQALRRPIDVYGATVADGPPRISRAEAEAALADPDSALGRLRTLMDAWVGLWFWPLDTGVQPPSWGGWLAVAEELVGVDERHGPAGQLGFDDLEALLAADDRDPARTPVADLVERHPWLGAAVEAARTEGAFHWELEFAPVFARGGFDLQVGNPPWTKLKRSDTVYAEDLDPHWALDGPPRDAELLRQLRWILSRPDLVKGFLAETSVSEGTREFLGSRQYFPLTADLMINLYMVFMDTTWRHLADRGVVGLLHPESHFVDPKAAALRRATYAHLRRHFQFINELRLFDDIHHMVEYGVHVYGTRQQIRFGQISHMLHPSTVDGSLAHDGRGPAPAIKTIDGEWDLRPHAARVLTITEEVLAAWARLFDEPDTPAAEARLLRPVTREELGALATLADQPTRLADLDYHWTAGFHEKNAKVDGIIRWETAVPASWDEVILQGPHFTVATPFAKQPNENCKSNRDYSDWDLETLPERVIPRTNYQRACDRATYDAALDHWNGRPSTSYWRHIHREMTQPGSMRSVQGAIVPPGTAHVHACLTYGFDDLRDLVKWAGLLASIPIDYQFRAAGAGHVAEHQLSRLGVPDTSPLDSALALRTLRLNCLTADYAPLWQELYDPAWGEDRWTDPAYDRVRLGDVEPTWSMATPLRRDYERRLALVELDALAALMLGLTAEQLCAMYRAQFAVLRKYEHAMVFDAEGRKICGHHQSAGYRQAQLQQQAKDGELPPEWKSIWKLVERWEDDPDSVDWLGHYTPPFTRPDREKEMTRAYEDFRRRLDGNPTRHTPDSDDP